jgi:hypothetical protein
MDPPSLEASLASPRSREASDGSPPQTERPLGAPLAGGGPQAITHLRPQGRRRRLRVRSRTAEAARPRRHPYRRPARGIRRDLLATARRPQPRTSTRDYYKLTWANHIMPRLGHHGVRELTPKRLARFREELERAGVGAATMRKTMAIIQSILSFAVAEELVEFNPAGSVRKPRYGRAREPHIFLPAEVERIRGQAAPGGCRLLLWRDHRGHGDAEIARCSNTPVRGPMPGSAQSSASEMTARTSASRALVC